MSIGRSAIALVICASAIGAIGCGGGSGAGIADSSTVTTSPTAVTRTVTQTVPVPTQSAPNDPSNYYGPGTADQARLDSDAKSNARIMVSYVEACYANTQDYTLCRTTDQLAQARAASGGNPPSQTEISKATRTTYVILAHSLSGNDFLVSKKDDGSIERTCVTPGKGGCLTAGIW